MKAKSRVAGSELRKQNMMSPLHRFGRTTSGMVALAVLVGTLGSFVAADELQPVLLLIDRDSISAIQPPNEFTTQDVNDELAAVGMRDNLPYFRRNGGRTVTLRTSRDQSPGWFALLSAPPSWSSDPGENDGLLNYVLAGPGLGSAEESGDRTRLLRDAGITGLRGANIEALQGRAVCAVVYQGDLTAGPAGADLSGKTLGLVAFKIIAVLPSGDSSPNVEVQILDAVNVCQGELALPEAGSSQ